MKNIGNAQQRDRRRGSEKRDRLLKAWA